MLSGLVASDQEGGRNGECYGGLKPPPVSVGAKDVNPVSG